METINFSKLKGLDPFVKMLDLVTRKLTDVRYMPSLKRNSISLGIFYTNGCSSKFENGFLRACKQSLVILEGFNKNSL